MPVNWSQEIQNVKAGQWRKINIKILHASDGNVQFQVTVETWVYDEKIDVDVMSSFYSYGEEEIPDEEISDENSPAVTLENGDIAQPYPITTSMFDFDVQSCSPMITAVVTPYQVRPSPRWRLSSIRTTPSSWKLSQRPATATTR